MNIPTWQAKLEVKPINTADEIEAAMQAEIDELRAALKVQPVAWTTSPDIENLKRGYTRTLDGRSMKVAPALPPHQVVYLYAAPVQPAPLSDAQIDNIWMLNGGGLAANRYHDFARAIEAAVRTGGAG